MKEETKQKINKILEKTFKNYKAVTFSENSKQTINQFVNHFIEELDKEINLERASKNFKSRESELIRNIEQLLIVRQMRTDESTVNDIEHLTTTYKGGEDHE